MRLFVVLILAAVLIGMGATLFPSIKEVTTTIFGDTTGWNPLLALFVSAWPLWILLAFVVGAFTLIRRR